jgi:hypothetical protein
MKNIGLTQGKIIFPESTTLEEFLKLPYIEESPIYVPGLPHPQSLSL